MNMAARLPDNAILPSDLPSFSEAHVLRRTLSAFRHLASQRHFGKICVTL